MQKQNGILWQGKIPNRVDCLVLEEILFGWLVIRETGKEKDMAMNQMILNIDYLVFLLYQSKLKKGKTNDIHT